MPNTEQDQSWLIRCAIAWYEARRYGYSTDMQAWREDELYAAAHDAAWWRTR